MNKENLQKQIEEMKTKLADMEAELNKSEVVINYWQPKGGEQYYYLDYFNIIEIINRADDGGTETRYRVFKTHKEAEKYAEYVKAEETLRRVIAEANEGWLPDWDGWEAKYGVTLDKGSLRESYFEKAKYFPNFMYIKSEELAKKLMKGYKAEFKTYLSY